VNKNKLGILAALVIGVAVMASPLHTWVVGETLTYADINANFSHIHSLMVGGHGPRLTNADVNGSAAISHAKLATPALVPKIWVTGTTPCTTTICTMSDSSPAGVVVNRTSEGVYVMTFPAARANAFYGVLISTLADPTIVCSPLSRATSTLAFNCVKMTSYDGGIGGIGYPTDAAFTVLIMDTN
jgi:hypothetical protein